MDTAAETGRGPGRPRGELDVGRRERLEQLAADVDQAKSALRAAALRALAGGASFSWTAAATGLSTHTLQRWKRETPTQDRTERNPMITSTLPDGIHAEALAGRAASGRDYEWVIVWADRTSDLCSRCGESIGREVGCPVTPGSVGNLEDWSQQHGCGQWNSIASVAIDAYLLDEDATDAAIEAAVRELVADRDAEAEKIRAAITARLRDELTEAIAALAAPLDGAETTEDREGDVLTGSEHWPGVWRDGEVLEAWNYDPTDDGQVLTVTENDLRA